ncbi:MAG: hypothetical protein WC756_10910 [Taibaiella sp.]|jgi:hypothetical protein
MFPKRLATNNHAIPMHEVSFVIKDLYPDAGISRRITPDASFHIVTTSEMDLDVRNIPIPR